MGKYNYKTGDVTHKGDFNIYQARHGGIMLLMAKRAVVLTKEQVDELPINPYELEDFDIDSYNDYYKCALAECSNENAVLPIHGVSKSVCKHCGGSGELAGGLVGCHHCGNY